MINYVSCKLFDRFVNVYLNQSMKNRLIIFIQKGNYSMRNLFKMMECNYPLITSVIYRKSRHRAVYKRITGFTAL